MTEPQDLQVSDENTQHPAIARKPSYQTKVSDAETLAKPTESLKISGSEPSKN